MNIDSDFIDSVINNNKQKINDTININKPIENDILSKVCDTNSEKYGLNTYDSNFNYNIDDESYKNFLIKMR